MRSAVKRGHGFGFAGIEVALLIKREAIRLSHFITANPGCVMFDTHYSSLKDSLIRRNKISEADLEESSRAAETAKLPLEKYLLQEGLLNDYQLLEATAAHLHVQPITLGEEYAYPKELVTFQDHAFWSRLKAIPLIRCDDLLTVAFVDPFDIFAQEEIRQETGCSVLPLIATEHDITAQLAKLRLLSDASNPQLAMENVMKLPDSELEFSTITEATSNENIEQMLETADDAPVIRMVNILLLEALKTNASDIHFEAMEKTSRLRYRIDGELIERPSPPKALHNAIVSRIKIMADLDIAERRIPQDGRFKIRALKKEVDIRVSILPTIHGEKIVMRTLDKSNLAPGLGSLGLEEYAYNAMKYAIDQPHGIILVTGPTGSGKTTTLYSCLQDLNQPNVNIITAEDPVEYELHGVNQVHVNQQVGLTFASVLRSVLRQDPDIVLVGEIRDGETADIAVKAALTGHLVLSTLHTNSAVGVVARLLDMGIPPFLLGSALICAQAQRLFRRLCPTCKQPLSAPFDPELLAANQLKPELFANGAPMEPVGCPKCHKTGYKGRGAIMEVMSVSDEIRSIITHGGDSQALTEATQRAGMFTLKDAGILKVNQGLTSLSAALEVTGGE